MSLIFNHQVDSISASSQVLLVSASGAIIMPKGNSAARPLTAIAGMTRFNTDTTNLEVYTGSAWQTPGQSFVAEVSVAAASTTDLGSQLSNVVNITGSSSISSFGSSALTINPIFIIKFAGSPTLLFNATSMILPGSANLTVSAGDSAIMQYLGSGNWKMLIHQKNSGDGIFFGGTVTGTANALVIAATTPGSFQLKTGSVIFFIPTASNTGAATLDTPGSTGVAFRKFTPSGLAALGANDLINGIPTVAQFNGTNWVLISNSSFIPPLSIVSTTQSITSTNVGTSYVSSAAVIFNLGVTTGFPANFKINLFARGGAITLTPNAADKINNGSTGASFVIPTGASGNLYTDGAGNWFMTGTALYATIANPVFTGTPAAPTPTAGDSSTQIATTAYVQTSGYNSQGVKTVSSSAPSGGNNGDIWYRI